MRIWKLIALSVALSTAGAASAAQMFHLTYTTSVDSVSGPAVSVDAILTTDDGDFYGAPGYQVTSITGTRGAAAISFDPMTLNDEIYYFGDVSGNFVDGFGLDFVADGVTYNLYRNGSGDFAYHEFDGTTGRLVFDGAIALSPAAGGAVPEPTAWATMLVGFAAVGVATRRRTTIRA